MTSKNARAEKICGLRPADGMAIDFPCELGFICPRCGDVGEFLQWSEYNTFIWCEKCDTDYPSVLCMPEIEKATEVYLDCVKHMSNLLRLYEKYDKIDPVS